MDLEAGGNVAGAKAVIAADWGGPLQTSEWPGAVVIYRTRPTVYRLGCALDRPPGLVDDRLMAEAYAKHWHKADRAADQIEGAAGVFRPTRAGREDNEGVLVPSEGDSLCRIDRVAQHPHRRALPLECLDQIEAEAVEIIDQEHVAPHDAPPVAASTESNAEALRRVSSASRWGSLS